MAPAARAEPGRDRELLPRSDGGIVADQSDEEFDAHFDAAIEAIYRASVT
ncbi:hypothetical protein BH23ACT3_BH23ACT3_07350 [soil metagenome]